MNGWFISILVLSAMSLGLSIGKHGQPRDKWNAWSAMIATLIELFLIIMAIRHGGLA